MTHLMLAGSLELVCGANPRLESSTRALAVVSCPECKAIASKD